MDWLAIIPVSVIVSLVVTLFFRWLDHEKPMLVLQRTFRDHGDAPEGYVRTAYELTNRGSATAFDIAMYGHLCDPAMNVTQPKGRLEWSYRIPQLLPGASVNIDIAWKQADFRQAALLLSYSRVPGRPLWYRTTSIKLSSAPSNLAYKPGELGTSPLPLIPLRAAAEESSHRAQKARALELHDAPRWRLGLLLSKLRRPNK